MAQRRSVKKKTSFIAKALAVGALACVLAGVVGFRVASASILSFDEVSAGLGTAHAFQSRITISPDVAVSSAVQQGQQPSSDGGKGATTASDAGNVSKGGAATDLLSNNGVSEKSPLAGFARADFSVGLKALSDRLEEERRRAEEAARIAEQKHIEEVQQRQRAASLGSLPAIDLTVGKAAFVEEWTERIDNYLAGSALAGYGSVFAEAAWECGVDPRWSPAISNTESSKGSFCFLSHNAWGWGGASWSNWTDAIWAHVQGLADGYGYTISQYAAAKYCPPNSVNWFNNTLSEMLRI